MPTICSSCNKTAGCKYELRPGCPNRRATFLQELPQDIVGFRVHLLNGPRDYTLAEIAQDPQEIIGRQACALHTTKQSECSPRAVGALVNSSYFVAASLAGLNANSQLVYAGPEFEV